MTKFRIVQVTCRSVSEARKIAKALLAARIAACVNIIPGVESHFLWKQKVEQSKEALLMVKTASDLVSKVMDKITKLHSYECPVIEVLAVEKMNKEAVKWIEERLQKNDY